MVSRVILTEGEQKVTSYCPGFKMNWDPTVAECRGCKVKYKEEYLVCEKVCGGSHRTFVDSEGDQVIQFKGKSQKSAQESEEPETVSAEEKIEKRKNKSGRKALCRQMVKQGKTEAEIKVELTKMFMSEGINEKKAKQRACGLFWSVKDEGTTTIVSTTAE